MLKDDPCLVDFNYTTLYNPIIAEQVTESGKQTVREVISQLERDITVSLGSETALGHQG